VSGDVKKGGSVGRGSDERKGHNEDPSSTRERAADERAAVTVKRQTEVVYGL
jgi:hypothetical protein